MRVVANEKARPVKIWASILEPEAEAQVLNLAKLPFIHSHVAVMPDAHAGKGSTVGTVIATKGAIIPAAVGVDIGCGMAAVKLPFQIDRLASSLPALRSQIEVAVPVGFAKNAEPCHRWIQFFRQYGNSLNDPDPMRTQMQLGSLGGGNHFIEVCGDENENAWIVIHSGSRGVGKQLADIHINGAKGVMKRYFIDLPDPDLAYLVHGTSEFNDYLFDLNWAQHYAARNREEILHRVANCVFRAAGHDGTICDDDVINCHHNYSAIENHFGANVWVTRKGAVSARNGQWGIIPGSMGTKSYIIQGKGNPQSFCSCSHGAGRAMSRTTARKRFTAADLAAQTAGVECRKDDGVLDELPAAYKDIDQVMADQADLVDVRYVLKQVLCVKG